VFSARWLVPKMVKNGIYSFFWGFGGSFEARALSAFTAMPLRSKRSRRRLNMLWEKPTSRRVCRAPMIHHPPTQPGFTHKQPQIEHEKAKEELRPI
jgi:hypothetical protein